MRSFDLTVDPIVHGQECARFDAFVVAGPAESDCAVWTGAIGKDGYGRFYIYRDGRGVCVRPHRWALARSLGRPLSGDEFGLHECDNPLCVKISPPGAYRLHVVEGTQRDNMLRMGRMGRGGGRRVIGSNGLADRRARSVALREALRTHGWDPAAVEAATLGSHPRLW